MKKEKKVKLEEKPGSDSSFFTVSSSTSSGNVDDKEHQIDIFITLP